MLCITANLAADDRVGSDSVLWRCPINVRITAASGRSRVIAAADSCAAAKVHLYSITSSAKIKSCGGIVSPSTSAVLTIDHEMESRGLRDAIDILGNENIEKPSAGISHYRQKAEGVDSGGAGDRPVLIGLDDGIALTLGERAA